MAGFMIMKIEVYILKRYLWDRINTMIPMFLFLDTKWREMAPFTKLDKIGEVQIREKEKLFI